MTSHRESPKIRRGRRTLRCIDHLAPPGPPPACTGRGKGCGVGRGPRMGEPRGSASSGHSARPAGVAEAPAPRGGGPSQPRQQRRIFFAFAGALDRICRLVLWLLFDGWALNLWFWVLLRGSDKEGSSESYD